MYYKFNKMTDWFIQNIRLLLYLLGLLYVDTVHHDVIIETCPFDILSATAMKDFRHYKAIFTEMRAKRLTGASISTPPLSLFVLIFVKMGLALKLISKILHCCCGQYIKRAGYYKHLTVNRIT